MTEKTKNPLSSDWLVPGLFCLAIAVLYLTALNVPLLGPDEPRYAQVAREMYERGDWVTPTLAGSNWFEKPVLLYWLQICSYSLFGVSEFAARFGSAVLGLLTISFLWLIGKLVDRGNSATGLFNLSTLLGFMAASTLGMIVFSRGASFDIVVTFAITGCLAAFFWAEHVPGRTRQRHAALFAFYVFLGLGLLAKGLIGLVFPAGIIVFYFLIVRRFPRKTMLWSTLWGLPVMLVVAGLWYVPMYLRHGWPFIDEFFVQHHFQRFTSNKYQHPQPFYFYLWVLPLMVLPWLPFAAISFWKTAVSIVSRDPREDENASRDLSYLAVSWVLVPTVFFSFSGSKLPGYILPAVPGAVCLAGIYARSLMEHRRRWRTVVAAMGLTLLAIVLVLLLVVFPGMAARDSVKPLITASTQQGSDGLRIYPLQTISHNAEFYAAGRLPRDSSGKQRRFESTKEIANEMLTRNESKALILAPLGLRPQLGSDESLTFTEIENNGKLMIAAVSPK